MCEILDQHRTLSVVMSGGLVQGGPGSGATEVDRQELLGRVPVDKLITSQWPAPTSRAKNALVLSSFVSSEKVVNDASKLFAAEVIVLRTLKAGDEPTELLKKPTVRRPV